MNPLCAAANATWFLSSLPASGRFASALKKPEEVQLAKLKSLLRAGANTAFGREHSFKQIHSYADFAAAVPIRTSDDFTPWLARIMRGEQKILTADRVTHLVPTSGTTSGRKLIPFTASLQREFDAAIAPWVCDLITQWPGLIHGPAYWSITPPNRCVETAQSKIPIGFASDASYLGGIKARLVDAVIVKPKPSRNLEEFRFETLRALLTAPDLRLISVWHPSFLLLLLDELPKHWDRLRRVCPGVVNLSPDEPAVLWPNLKVVSSWGDEHASSGFNQLARRFPEAQVQPKGLLASECFVTLPFRGQYPLAIRSHFFEFLGERGQPWLAQELEPGKTYEIVVTTAGGLYRYKLGDRALVTSFLEETPCFRFVGRTGLVSDLRGEKLTDEFVASCIRRLNGNFTFAMLAPSIDSDPPYYTLFIEGDCRSSLAWEFESHLRENPHYANAVDLGQLGSVRLLRIAANAYEIYSDHLVRQGSRLGEIKPSALSMCSRWADRFPPLVV
jgi:hypothetical protein